MVLNFLSQVNCDTKRNVAVDLPGIPSESEISVWRRQAVTMPCRAAGTQCSDCDNWTVCTNVNGVLLPVISMKCSEIKKDYVCNDELKECSATTTDKCKPGVPGAQSRCKTAGYFPDPDDCKKYYICTEISNGIFIEEIKTCNDPRSYNASSELCEIIDNTQCTSPSVDCQNTFIAGFAEFPEYFAVCIPIPGDPPTHNKLVFKCPEDYTFNEKDKECQPNYCKSKGRHPDPESCTSFYQCVPKPSGKGFDVTKGQCPLGTAFSPIYKLCMIAAGVPGCSSSPITLKPVIPPTTGTGSHPVTNRPTGSNSSDPATVCKNSNKSRVQDPTNCRRYYLCVTVNGSMVGSLRTCPEGFYFNSQLTLCRRGNC